MNLTVEKICSIVNGTLYKKEKEIEIINNIMTDSRKSIKNSIFIPIKGENFDGHDFINDAFEKGAVITLSEKDLDIPYIKVEDTLKAYCDIAKYHRNKIDPIVIGITGSVGKTTTKEFISSVLEKKFSVLKTYKNYNNIIGVAQTLLNLKTDHEVLVLEMGIDHVGEMDILTDMARPNFSVLTNVGKSHVGNFPSEDVLLKEKFKIFSKLNNNDFMIYFGDDSKLKEESENYTFKKYSFGYNEYNEAKLKSIECNGILGNTIRFKFLDREYLVNTKAIGKHLGYSILPAVIIGEILKVEKDDIINAIQEDIFMEKRMNIINLDGKKIINDSYNASYESITSALYTLDKSKTDNFKIAFLGDIFELGAQSIPVHKEIGDYLLKNIKTIDKIVFIGKAMRYAYNVANNDGSISCDYYENKEKLKEKFDKYKKNSGIILLKGSRGMKMEEIIDFYDNN